MKLEYIATIGGALGWALTMILGILKFIGEISISWWLVFTPVLILVGIAIIVALFALGIVYREFKKTMKSGDSAQIYRSKTKIK